MNILVLSNAPVVESQGSGYVIVNTVKSLTNLGHKVDVVPPDFLMVLTSWESRARNYRFYLGIANWIYTNRKKVATYQLIIFYGAECALAVFVLKQILKLDIPIILHSNGLEMHVDYRMDAFVKSTNVLKWYNFDQSWVYKYCYNNVDAILTVSKFDRDFAVQHLKINPEKVYFIEPALPEEFFNAELKSTVTRKPIIVYCGSWIARKGIQVLTEVIPDILRKYPAYTFRLIGTGNEFKVEDNFPAEILDRIEIYPLVESKKQMIHLYSESSIFVFPSIHESFGLVTAEAMSCGCAVVCSQTGFATNIANGKEAIVLEAPDKQHVYEAVEKLITDAPLRQELSSNAQKRVQQLRWSTYQTQLSALLTTVVKQHH